MNTDTAFIQAILASPEDRAVRLVYADWLEDNGDPERAEFIRAQCRLARMEGDDPERRELSDRADDLHGKNRERWRSTRAL